MAAAVAAVAVRVAVVRRRGGPVTPVTSVTPTMPSTMSSMAPTMTTTRAVTAAEGAATGRGGSGAQDPADSRGHGTRGREFILLRLPVAAVATMSTMASTRIRARQAAVRVSVARLHQDHSHGEIYHCQQERWIYIRLFRKRVNRGGGRIEGSVYAVRGAVRGGPRPPSATKNINSPCTGSGLRMR